MGRVGRAGFARAAVTGLLIALISILCIFPAASWAHALPDRSDPKVGATVKSSPEVVRVWFDCEIQPASSKLMVRNASNKRVDRDDSRVNAADHKLLEVSVPTLPSGRYRVFWNVVAKDGHPGKGDFTFRVR